MPGAPPAADRPTLVELEDFGLATDGGFTTGCLTLSLRPGDAVLLAGTSGSGKSLIAERLAGVRRPGTWPVGLRRDRPGPLLRVGFAPQDARLAVLPTDRVATVLGRGTSGARGVELLERLGLDPGRVLRLPCRDLSASERYRVLVALALRGEPELVVLDGHGERTDFDDMARIASELERARRGGAAVVVTSRVAEVAELRGYATLELSDAAEAEPPLPLVQRAARDEAPPSRLLVSVERLRVTRGRRGLLARRPAAVPVDGVSLRLLAGEVLVLLGPSGSGKTTLLETLAGLHAADAGRLEVDGRDYATARGRRLRRLRALVQLVFQDAPAALDGRRSVRAHLLDAAALGRTDPSSALAWMQRLKLPPRLLDLPAEMLSASEAARVDLARSLAVGPRCVLLDAPRSAALESDGGTLAAVIASEKARGVAFLVATSDPGVARALGDRVAVLYAGRLLEVGLRDAVLESPLHPGTAELAARRALPRQDPRHPPVGCPLATGCSRSIPGLCDKREPELLPTLSRQRGQFRHRVACHHPLGEEPRPPLPSTPP